MKTIIAAAAASIALLSISLPAFAGYSSPHGSFAQRAFTVGAP